MSIDSAAAGRTVPVGDHQGPDPDSVKAIFSKIAPRYDLLNRLLSMGLDQGWRRSAAAQVRPVSGELFLDLAAGTGAFSGALRLACPGIRIVAADFCVPILSRTSPNIARRTAADALNLPFRNGVFDGFVMAFGLRNFADPLRGLSELARTLRPGGRGLVLEFLRPEPTLFGFLYRLYLRLWVPFLGGVLSGSFSAYRHLTRTISGFYSRSEFRDLASRAGFEVAEKRELTLGSATALLLIKKS